VGDDELVFIPSNSIEAAKAAVCLLKTASSSFSKIDPKGNSRKYGLFCAATKKLLDNPVIQDTPYAKSAVRMLQIIFG